MIYSKLPKSYPKSLRRKIMTVNPQGKPIKPSFPIARRDQPLRNLVSCLLAQESVETTLSRALAISKYAERCITWGKTGQKMRLSQFLYNPVKIPSTPPADPVPNYFLRDEPVAVGPPMRQDSPMKKVLSTFAARYRKRQGGYTRVIRLPNRKRDNAKMALVEMIDNPREVRSAMLARIVAREMVDSAVSTKAKSPDQGKKPILSPSTAEKAAKALRYKTDEQRREWDERVTLHAAELIRIHFGSVENMQDGEFKTQPISKVCLQPPAVDRRDTSGKFVKFRNGNRMGYGSLEMAERRGRL